MAKGKADNTPRHLIELCLRILGKDIRRIQTIQNRAKGAALNEKLSEAASRYLTKLQALADYQEAEAVKKQREVGKLSDAELKKLAASE